MSIEEYLGHVLDMQFGAIIDLHNEDAVAFGQVLIDVCLNSMREVLDPQNARLLDRLDCRREEFEAFAEELARIAKDRVSLEILKHISGGLYGSDGK